MMSSGGTGRGKLSSVGSRIVKTGMDSSRFDGWGWNSFHVSFVLCMIARDVRKKLHSMRLFVRLAVSNPIPYQ